MKTLDDVKKAFTHFNTHKLDAGGAMRALRLNIAYADLAYDVCDYSPVSETREIALQHLLNSRNSAIQAVVDEYSLENVPTPDRKITRVKAKRV